MTLPPTPPPSPCLGPNCTQIQTEERIPSNHSGLQGNDEEWVHRLIPARSLDEAPSAQRRSVHVINNRPGEDVDVAVIKSHIQSLGVGSHPVTIKRCLYEPSEKEKHVYGTHKARLSAQRCFIENAVRGILKCDPGLGRFYRQHVDDIGLLAVIEWAILQRDIEASSPDVLDQFLLSCLFVTLVPLDNLCGDFVVNDLKKRDRDKWMKLIQEVCIEHRACPPEDPDESIHKAAILRVLLEGRVQDASHFDSRRSVNDDLMMLCDLFVGFDEPMSFRCFDDWAVPDFLLRGPLKCGYEEVVKLQRIPRIWFPEEIYETWPAAVVNALPCGVVREAWKGRHLIYEQAPSLRADPENELQVLLCYCTKEGRFPAIKNWADGPSWYKSTKGRLHGSSSAEQVALTVTALLSYAWFAGSETKSLASYGHLLCFIRKRIAGKGLENRREVWKFMAGSIQEFLGEEYMPHSFLDGLFTEEPPLHWPHGLVDMYQICAGRDGWVLVEGD